MVCFFLLELTRVGFDMDRFVYRLRGGVMERIKRPEADANRKSRKTERFMVETSI